MKIIRVLVPAVLLAAGSAAAQPTFPTPDSPNTLPGDPEEPQPVATTTAEPDPQPVAQTTAAPAYVPMQSEPAAQRPTEFAIGLGVGYVFPSDLSAPNTTSARFRLASGLVFEPRVTLGHESATNDDGIDEQTTSTNAVDVAVAVRYPLRSHGKVDFSLVGAAGVGLTTINPDGDDNNRKINSFGVSWGIALDYWINPHWDLSFTAGNPLFQTTVSTQEQGPGTETSDSRTSFGAIFDPTLAVMLHLYL